MFIQANRIVPNTVSSDHFTASHPNIFPFLDKLEIEFQKSELKIRFASRTAATKRRRALDRENKKSELVINYVNGEISLRGLSLKIDES